MSQYEDAACRPLTLGVNQVAQLLGLSKRTIYRLLDAGKIPKPIQLGGTVRWPRTDIELFIEAGSIRAFRRAKRA